MHPSAITRVAGEISPLPEIIHAAFIRADPSRVFGALTTAEGLDVWFTRGAKVHARLGGRILFR